MRINQESRIERILIVNVNWLGDVLFSTPAIRAIRRHYADAYIACLIVPRCREILEGNPNLDEIIVYDEEGKHKNIWGKLKIIFYLRSKNFSQAIVLHRSFTRVFICALAGIPTIIGYYTKKRGFLLTYKVKPPDKQLHRVEYFLNLLKSVGIETENNNLELFVGEQDSLYINDLLKKEGITEEDLLVAINPGGNWRPKRWPSEAFARLADELIKIYNAKVIITGAEKDVGLAQEISSLMKHKPIIFCGKTTLKQLGALLRKARLVISNDSGPLHIAVAVGTRVIALFGPTSPLITGPYGKGEYALIHKDVGCKVPCYKVNCSDNRCMKAISVEEVLENIKNQISKIKNGNR